MNAAITFDRAAFAVCAERWVNKRAAEVLPADWTESFQALDLKAKVTGIAFFAAVSNDTEMKDAALEILKTLEM